VIAVDTSTWVAYLQGDTGSDVRLLDTALGDKLVVIPPVVLTELLSDPKLPPDVAADLIKLPALEVSQGYWERAGALRARVLARQRKARLGDALIAQSCVDHDVTLLTRDRDFRAFAAAARLDLVVGS
jgi:predicted nucleic acid-binding protein